MQSILGNTRKADITFYASGRIDISARVAKHLQLSRGDVLDIMIDQDEFYLYVRLRSPNGRHEAWYSQQIRQEIISELHQADFVQQFSKNVEQQLKQDYV